MWSLFRWNLSLLVPLYLIFHNRYCHSVRQQLFQWRNNLEYRWPTGFYSWSLISPGLCERVFRKWQLHRLYLVWECWVGSIVEFLTSKSFIIFFSKYVKSQFQYIKNSTLYHSKYRKVAGSSLHRLVAPFFWFSEGLCRWNLMLMYCDLWQKSSKIE